MSLPLIFINGKQTHDHSVLDRAFMFGDGVFETLLCLDARLPLWDLHKQRLMLGCQQLHIHLELSHLEKLLSDALAQVGLDNAVCKITVTRGVGGRGYGVDNATEPTIVIGFFSYPDHIEALSQSGVSLGICTHRLALSAELAGIKHLNRLDNVLAKRECQSRGLEDGVVCDQQGGVIEATSSNLFLRFDDQWITPEISQSGVKGITRRVILEMLAPELKLPVVEGLVAVEQLADVDEIFICNSVNGIVPVTGVGDVSLTIGLQTRGLQNAYKRLLKEKQG
ncbi:aminodeoxychorismate lyase [Maricurvus nonylphenolicus]|uniref:aminodeoxychorismate lyase n=1 Tax=Maricurvus nonylphenolicus TaxID=1008307 RepID=UPI0036F28598